MTVRIEWVGYGRPAAEALRRAIGVAKGDAPLATVTVVVPSNQVGVAARRLLGSGAIGPVCAAGTGLAAVSFLTVYRLAELLGAARLAGAGRRPVSTPVIAAALRGALAEGPGVFASVAAHPATETALVSAYRELRDVSPGALDHLAAQSERAADVVRLHRMARARSEREWYDEPDLTAAAADVLASDAGMAAHLGGVIVYLPQHLSRHGSGLLTVTARSGELVVLAGTTGDSRADADVTRSVRRLDDSLTARDAPHGRDPMDLVNAERTRIVTTSDADEEVRAVVRSVVDAARGGAPLERIAILHASPQPYARLVHEQLAAAGIPHNGPSVMPLTARVAARTLLGLLALPSGRFRRDDVFAWLAGAPLLRRERWIPVTAWERISRGAGVVAGRDHWDRLLVAFASNCETEAERLGPEEPLWKAERLRADATRAGELRAFVLGLMDDIAGAASGVRPWAERAAWARGHLTGLLGDERRRGSWPQAERKAAERVDSAVDRLATLDRVEGPVALDVFSRTLEHELDADIGRVGRMGEGVMVGPVGMGVGLDLDLVAILGLAEGSFPTPTRDDSLLPDHERETIGDDLPLRSQRVERQHHDFLAALAGSAHHLLSVPRGDLRRSNQRVPSRWVLDVAGSLAGERWWSEDLLGGERDWLTHVASFDAGIRHLEFPASEQEHRLRALMAAGPSPGSGAGPPAVRDTVLEAGAAMVMARHSDRLTRYDGNLGGLSIPSPVDRNISPTRLEQWATCPFAYLLHTILRVDEVENPEDRLRITPRDRGSLIHTALETFITEVLARPVSEQPEPTEEWSPAAAARMVEIGDTLCIRYETLGLTGRPIFWQHDQRQIRADLERFLHADSNHRRDQGTRPVAAELAFGFPGAAVAAAALPLPDGRSVHFHGLADRLDVARDGTIHVVDYKTGSPRDFMDVTEDNPDAQGTKLQLVVYGLAGRLQQGSPDAPVRAEYWFTSAKGQFRRIGYPVTAAVLERVGRTAAIMVAGIEAGVFPSRPTATSTKPFVECAFCDPDALGVVDLRRRFERKKADAAMKPFLDLVEFPLA